MLTVHAALTAWTADPVGLAVVLAGALWYGRRIRSLAGPWSAARTACFGAGLLLVLYATCGEFGAYGRTFLWAYTAQVMVLLVLAPALLLLGRPVTLARAAGGDSRVARVADSRAVSGLAHPALGPVLLPLVTALLFFTPLLGIVQTHGTAYAAAQLVLLGAGLVMAVGITGEGRPVSSLAMAAVILCAFLELLADAIPGIAMRLRDTVLDPAHYLAVARGRGPSPLDDLHLAGSILWFVAETVDLPVLAILVLVWIRTDEREAREVDRRLDAMAAPERVDVAAPPDGTTPWWVSDGQVFGERRAARYRTPR